VLNGLLALLNRGAVNLRLPVAFLLGNPWAAKENKRFLERDLNRSFNRKDPAAAEELRARDLGAVLKDTAYIVDYHQTSRVSERPFFIFPYGRRSLAFARAVGPRQTIVTHWGRPFSSEGMCSDEFVNSQGGTGISLELGQNGFDPYQIAVGIECGLWALRTVTDELEGRAKDAHPVETRRAATEAEIYTWADIMPWPAAGTVALDEGWYNFRDVARGQRLGTLDGKPLLATVDGKMLFPKYLTAEQQRQLESRPTELCRIMKRINEVELPGDR
jgi:hypothetical protein